MRPMEPITSSPLRRSNLRFALHVCAVALFLLLALRSWGAETAAPPLDQVLARTGQRVATFLDQFGQVTCTEVVMQEKLRRDGQVDVKQQQSFDLLTMVELSGDELRLNESRLPLPPPRPAPRATTAPLLVTNGFSTLLLIFHPYYQPAFEFSRIADDTDAATGRHWLRLQFRHVKGMRSPTALLLHDRVYPIDLQGTAWIDADSGMIVKIEAELGSSLDDLGLRQFRSEVRYARVDFRGESLWLPLSATVEVQTPRQHWRNVHNFTAYRRFSVSTVANASQ